MARDGRITIFISSSMTELEYDRQIAEQALKDMNVTPILFEVFPAVSYSPNESCRDEVRDCDIFLMLLWKTLTDPVLEEYYEAVERNKPILILIKSLIANEEPSPKLKEFLDELNSDSKKRRIPRVTYKNYRKITELRVAVQDSVAAETARLFKQPIYTMARNELYELGISIIRYAQRRLYLFQRTPSLILGARPYLAEDSKKYAYEKEFVDALETWIEDNYKLNDKEFLYLFSAEATKKEIEEEQLSGDINHLAYIKYIKKNAQKLKEREVESGSRFRIRTLDVPISGPLIVGDDRYAIWVL